MLEKYAKFFIFGLRVCKVARLHAVLPPCATTATYQSSSPRVSHEIYQCQKSLICYLKKGIRYCILLAVTATC